MQKLTLTVPGELIAQAKHKAIDKNTSISKVVTEALRSFVEDKQARSGASLTAGAPSQTYDATADDKR